MEEGTFVEWLKREGDRVEPGQPLFVLESDKSAENVEAIHQDGVRIRPAHVDPNAHCVATS